MGEIATAMGGSEARERLVVGKPSEKDQATNGWMSMEMLKTCLDEGQRAGGGKMGGAMMWQVSRSFELRF